MARSKTYELSFQVGATLAGSFSKVFKGAESALQQVNGQLGVLGKQQAANSRLMELRESLETSSLKLRAAKQNMEQLRQEMTAAGAPTKQMQNAMDKAAQAVQKAQTQVDKERAALHELNAKMGTAGTSTKQLADHQKRLAEHAEKAAKAQERLQRIVAAQDANKANRANIKGEMFGAVAMAASVAMPAKSAIDNAAAWNHANQLIGNTADMTAEQIKAMGKEMLDAAAATNQNANALQTAQGFLVAAGLDAATARASIATIGRTTTAAGADIEDLSSAAFTLIDALKIKPEGLQNALDILAVAGKEGNVELKDMAKVLPVLSSSFVALKMEGNEAAATMGAALEVARKGAANADEAANNMKNYLAKVMSPETLKKAQKNFNLDLYKVITDAQKTGSNPFEKSVEAIMKATAGDQKKIGELFGDMQVQNFIRPMMQNWDEYQRIKDKALNSSSGTTDTDFAKMMETDAEKMKQAQIASDILSKRVGEALAPAWAAVSAQLAKVMGPIGEWVQENPTLVAGVVGITGALLAANVAALAVRFAFTYVKGAVLAVQGAMAAARAGWLLYTGAMVASNTTSKTAIVLSKAVAAGQWLVNGALAASRWVAVTAQIVIWRTTALAAAAGAKVMAAAQWVLNAAMSANPIGLVIAGIGALIAAGVALYKNWDTVSAFFSGAWDRMKGAAMAVVDWIKGLSFYDSGKALLKTMADGIKAAAAVPVEAIKGALAKVREYLPFSDAHVGPLSELTLSGTRVMTTLGEGMAKADIAEVTAPLRGIAAAANDGVNGGTSQAPARGGDTFHITIQVPAGNDPVAARAAGVAAAESFEQKMREYTARRERLSYAPA